MKILSTNLVFLCTLLATHATLAQQTSSPGSGTLKTGTASAVRGAKTSAAPAVIAGSTERNTSIHDFIASSPNYSTLQNALQSADIYNTLKLDGPYTLFAPSNAAFKKLPARMQAGLLEGRNRDALKQLLTYHLVQGLVDRPELTKRIKAGGGKARLHTVAGGMLTVQMNSNERLSITDEQGKTSSIESGDTQHSNGVVHGVSEVLLPKNAADRFR